MYRLTANIQFIVYIENFTEYCRFLSREKIIINYNF